MGDSRQNQFSAKAGSTGWIRLRERERTHWGGSLHTAHQPSPAGMGRKAPLFKSVMPVPVESHSWEDPSAQSGVHAACK